MAQTGIREKGRMTMSAQSNVVRNLLVVFASLLMSSIAVGSAVGPAEAIANPVQVAANA